LDAAYNFLALTIRNRDAHAYVPSVRDAHHYLVAALFAECFNLIVSWLLPNGPYTLNEWTDRDTAKKYIENREYEVTPN
jgi:hypothetical protein